MFPDYLSVSYDYGCTKYLTDVKSRPKENPKKFTEAPLWNTKEKIKVIISFNKSFYVNASANINGPMLTEALYLELEEKFLEIF